MVYCKDCKFYRYKTDEFRKIFDKCLSKPFIHRQSSYIGISYYKNYAKPAIKNQHNDCVEFKPTLLKIFSTFFNRLRNNYGIL